MPGFKIKQGSRLSKNVTKDNVSSLLGFGGGGAAVKAGGNLPKVRSLVKSTGKQLKKISSTRSKSSSFIPHLANVERGIKDLEKLVKKMPSSKVTRAKHKKLKRTESLVVGGTAATIGTIGAAGIAGVAKMQGEKAKRNSSKPRKKLLSKSGKVKAVRNAKGGISITGGKKSKVKKLKDLSKGK
jgi:hypothetical protein|tara:strand:+ start:1502 stop:2053 length:552 start_codon:yes stop_codon:yes gene_type:complete